MQFRACSVDLIACKYGLLLFLVLSSNRAWWHSGQNILFWNWKAYLSTDSLLCGYPLSSFSSQVKLFSEGAFGSSCQ